MAPERTNFDDVFAHQEHELFRASKQRWYGIDHPDPLEVKEFIFDDRWLWGHTRRRCRKSFYARHVTWADLACDVRGRMAIAAARGKRYSPLERTYRGYWSKVIHRVVLDIRKETIGKRRKKKSQPQPLLSEPVDSEIDPAVEIIADELISRVLAKVQELKPADRILISGRLLRDPPLSWELLAVRLTTTVSAAKRRYHRVIQALRAGFLVREDDSERSTSRTRTTRDNQTSA